MKILVSGASGLVGGALVPFLTSGGHEVVRLVRRPPSSAKEVRWDPEAGSSTPAALEGYDALIHLAGENIASGRWSAARKERIRSSRVQGTRSLVRVLAGLGRPPRAFLCASAIGFYGSRGDELLKETSGPGEDFLAGVCREWEAASEGLPSSTVRSVHMRFGVILSPRGGALQRMLLPFRMGVGGRLGAGTQWMSWIGLDDVLGGILHVLEHEELSGPVNFVAPNPLTNAEFTRVLARVLGRPAVLPAPAFALRLALGEMAQALLLSSQRVEPAVLLRSGYSFAHNELEHALRHLLGRGPESATVERSEVGSR